MATVAAYYLSLIVVIAPCLIPVVVVEADIFASVVDLTATLKSEQSVIEAMKEYVTAEATRLNEVRQIIDEIEQNNEDALVDPEQKLSNIISGFQTIARLTVDWQNQLQTITSTENLDKLKNDIESATKNYPDKHDLRRAAESVFRLQDVYALEVEQFANGSLAQEAVEMTAKDCYQVAEVAYEQDDLYHSTMWFTHALKMVVEQGDKSIERAKVYEYLIFAFYTTNKLQNLVYALKLCEQWELYDPSSENVRNNVAFYKGKLRKAFQRRLKACDMDKQCERGVQDEMKKNEPLYERVRKDWEEDEDYMRFETLCRGEDVYSSHELKCSYRRYNALHVLRPLKEEVMLNEPFIAVYHDFISDREIDLLKSLAGPKLHRSIIFGTEDQENKDTHIRTSKTAWLHDNLDPVIQRVTMRSVSIGNLSHLSCDEMQVVCYGLGGHYSPHYDWANDEKFRPTLGDRMATVVHYISDFVGGSTVFLKLGVKVPPRKGSTLFWWNLHKDLSGDERNMHAGCPVIYGNKWIANKWVHRMDQLFTRPCSLEQVEPDSPE